MNFLSQPWQLLLLILTEWVQHQQQQVIDYLTTENQVLKEKLGKGRLLLNDDQRRRLAVKGKILGRKQLSQVASLVAADTILRWHRELVPHIGDRRCRGQKRVGRKPLSAEIRQFVVRMASENLRWGYDRIQGAMANLGLQVSASSVGNILRDHGIEPAPRRSHQMTWETFVKAHWEVLRPVDFTTITEWLGKGLLVWQLLCGSKAASRRERCLSSLVAVDPISMWPVSRDANAAASAIRNSRPEVFLGCEAESGQPGVSGEREVKPNWLHSRSLSWNVERLGLWVGEREGEQERGRLAA
jgi:transposase